MFNPLSLTYAVFEPDDQKDASEVARKLSARNHFVTMHPGDEFMTRRLPVRGVALRRTMTNTIVMLGGVALVALAVSEIAGLQWFAGGLGSAYALVAVAVALFFGGLTGLLNGVLSAAPELRKAEEALSEPGRFALTVSTPKEGSASVEAELARAGAVTVGSF